MHGDIPADVLLLDGLLVEPGRGALGEAVAALLGPALVGLDVVAQQLGRLVLLYDADVDVATRTQVVEDTGLDGLGAQLDSLVPRQLRLPHRLEHRHGGQGTGTHGHVGQLVRRAVGVDGEEADAGRVDACDDEVGADVALVSEEVLLQHGHAGDDAGGPPRREGVELDVRADQGGGELCVCSCTCTSAPDLRGDVVEFLAVLEMRVTFGQRGSGFPGFFMTDQVANAATNKRRARRNIHTLSATIGPLVALVSAAIWCPVTVVSLTSRGLGFISAGGWAQASARQRRSYHNAVVEYTPHDRRSGAGGLGKGDALGMEGRIAVVVGEVEACHGDRERSRAKQGDDAGFQGLWGSRGSTD